MKNLFLLLFLFSALLPVARAGMIVSVGPSALGSYDSEAEASSGKKVLSADGTLGYNIGVEAPLLKTFLTFNLNVLYGRSEATTQYRDLSTGITANDQKSTISNSGILLGLRLRPINFKYWNVFVGGGGFFGSAKFRHDIQDYEERHGSAPANFNSVEKVNQHGHYLEGGTELIFNKNNGVRLMAQMLTAESEKFQTLADKPVKGTFAVATVQWIHYFEKVFSKK